MLTATRWASLATTAFLLVGCDAMELGDSQRFHEDFHYSYDLQPGGRISLENMNGSVEIIGQDTNKVDISGTKYASTEQVLQAMKIDVVASGDSVRIRTVPPSGHRGNHGARYVIRVPRRVELDRIGSSNGSIRVDGVEGTVRLRTSNGSVRAFRVKGPAEIETSNASIELFEQVGSVVAHTSNGSIKADGVKGYFEATTSNGSIDARVTDPEPDRPVKLESSNGGIKLAMDTIRNNDIRASTSNSSITLRLPSAVNARLKARTSNGSINNELGALLNAGQTSKTHLEGTLGSGGPTIDLSTSNGRINLQKL